MNESNIQTTQDRHLRRLLTSLATTQPQTVYLRDGDLVLYRRSRSLLYQCRYKLNDGSWHRQTTGKASLEQAIARACALMARSNSPTRGHSKLPQAGRLYYDVSGMPIMRAAASLSL